MIEHSSIYDAEHACMVASQAPVFSEADFDCLLELLEQAHSRLRSVFIGGQDPSVPSNWRIDGLEYRRLDIMLVTTKTKLEQRFKASKFFAGQRRHDRSVKKAKENLSEWRPIDGGVDQFWKMKQQGFDVRRIERERKTVYQFATRKEV